MTARRYERIEIGQGGLGSMSNSMNSKLAVRPLNIGTASGLHVGPRPMVIAAEGLRIASILTRHAACRKLELRGHCRTAANNPSALQELS